MRVLLLTLIFTIEVYGFDYTDILSAGHNRTKSVRVLGKVLNSKEELVTIVLPFTKIQDIHSGEIFYSDESGEVHLPSRSDNYRFFLTSKYFNITKKNHETSFVANGEKDVVFNDYLKLEDINVRGILELGRRFVLKNLDSGFHTNWFFEQVPVELDFASGCNAAWNGSSILINSGNNFCTPALSNDIILHEYGHGILENIGPERHYLTDFSEGFADSFMSLMTDDPYIAEGLKQLAENLSKPTHWSWKYLN